MPKIVQRTYGWLDKITDKKELFATIRQLGKTDLYFLCKYILGLKDLETRTSLHYGLCEFLETMGERGLVVMFRESFKTSIGMGRVIQWIINNADEEVGIGSDITQRADQRVLVLKNTLETCEPLKYFYPDIFYKNPSQEADVWTASAFNVKRTPYRGGMRMPSVSGFGLFPLPTGAHFSKVLMDDPENESNVNTEDLVAQLVTRIGALMPVLQAGAQYLQLGTLYHEKGPNTIYQKFWPTYRVPIIDKEGKPTFPSRFPMERILMREKEINDPYIWAGQYLLKHHPRTGKFFYPFRGDHIKTYNYAN